MARQARLPGPPVRRRSFDRLPAAAASAPIDAVAPGVTGTRDHRRRPRHPRLRAPRVPCEALRASTPCCDLCGAQLGRNAGHFHMVSPLTARHVSVCRTCRRAALGEEYGRGPDGGGPRAGAGRRVVRSTIGPRPAGRGPSDESDQRRDDATARCAASAGQSMPPRSGSCARPDATSPSIAPSARSSDFSSSAGRPTGRRDHAAAARPLRPRRRHHLRRHPAAAGRHGHRLSLRRPATGRSSSAPVRCAADLEGCGRATRGRRALRPRRHPTGVRELAGRVPLIGFAGAPFTLASY